MMKKKRKKTQSARGGEHKREESAAHLTAGKRSTRREAGNSWNKKRRMPKGEQREEAELSRWRGVYSEKHYHMIFSGRRGEGG